jgi:polysaccharide deacetylase family protein (PEP-CTERM system associated)
MSMEGKKKIAFVITRMIVGGAQEMAKRTAEFFAAEGNDVLLISGIETGREGELSVGCPVIRIPFLVRRISPVRDVRAVFRLMRIFHDFRPDIVHAQTAKARFLTSIAARLSGIEVVIQAVHGWSFNNETGRMKPLFVFLEKIAARLSLRTVLVSEADMAEGFRMKILKEGRTELIHPGVDFRQFETVGTEDVASLRRQYASPGERLVVLVGRLSKPKTPEVFVRAAARLLTRLGGVKFLVIGDGPKREEVARLVADRGIGENVKMLGLRPDAFRFIAAGDVVVHSSTHEGLPKTVLEGMAAGKPVIGTDVGGVAALIEPGVTGLLVKPFDDEGLAGAILKLISDPGLGAKLGKNAREKAAGYTLDKTLRDTKELYEKMSSPVLNAFTVDVEDWYQGLEVIDTSDWGAYPDRVDIGLNRILDLLAEAGHQATFFVLGYVAEKHPVLVEKIAAAGHEIGTHGYWHRLVYNQEPEQFRRELRDSIAVLEAITGRKISGFRAPFFSITRESLWALDILAQEGIRYDSSILPVVNYRYGIPGSRRFAHRVPLDGGRSIIEIPVSVHRYWGMNFPVCGGAYLRILPMRFMMSGIRGLHRSRQPLVSFIHPWELDPGHPRIKLPRRISLTHYRNLERTESRLKRLLGEYRFGTIQEVFHV